MTKKQLLKKLENVSGETEIIVASDEEGNSYLRLREVYKEDGLKFFDQDYQLNLVNKDDLHEYGISEERFKKLKNCIVLFP